MESRLTQKEVIIKHYRYECDCGLCSGDDEWVDIVVDEEVLITFYEVGEAKKLLNKLGIENVIVERISD